MSLIVLLDAGPLGMITNPKSSPENEACKNWLASLAYNAVEVMIPEIADYEVRRELLRAGKDRGLGRLDALKSHLKELSRQIEQEEAQVNELRQQLKISDVESNAETQTALGLEMRKKLEAVRIEAFANHARTAALLAELQRLSRTALRNTLPTASPDPLLNDLLAKLQTTGNEADMVCGSRFRGDPGYKVPIGRRVGNLIFSVVLTAICRQRITDPTSGFRMTNRRGIELFARDYPHDYPEVEAILMLHAHRLRIHEVPVHMNARGFGRSSIDYPRSAYYMAKVLLALFVGLFRRRPTPVEATGEHEMVEPPANSAATSGGPAA